MIVKRWTFTIFSPYQEDLLSHLKLNVKFYVKSDTVLFSKEIKVQCTTFISEYRCKCKMFMLSLDGQRWFHEYTS